jgi:hypothetical protein
MKVGFSFGRCVRDIVNGTVDIKDVMVILARTRMESAEHVDGVVEAYMDRRGYLWGLDETRCKEVASQLYQQGKIFQPRLENHYPGSMVHESYVWMDLFPTTHEDNDLVRKAWQQYQVALRLVGDGTPEQIHGRVPQQDDRW